MATTRPAGVHLYGDDYMDNDTRPGEDTNIAAFNTAGGSDFCKNGTPDGRRLGTTDTVDAGIRQVRGGHDSARTTVETVRSSGVVNAGVLLSRSMSTPNPQITRRACAYSYCVYLCPLEAVHPRTCSHHSTPYPGHFGVPECQNKILNNPPPGSQPGGAAVKINVSPEGLAGLPLCQPIY